MITLKLTEQEVGVLVALMDAGVKAVGLQGAKAAALLTDKIEAAVKVAKEESKDEVKLDG